MKSFSVSRAASASAARAGSSNDVPLEPVCSAARSSTWSPIAMPPRIGSLVPARRNTPNGRFWIGKSLVGSLAELTQLFSPGSWVSFSRIMPGVP
jgi:hypothetical protein